MAPKVHSALAPEIASKLGKVSDRELAKLSGLSPYFIKQARLAKGIDAVGRGYDLPVDLLQQLGKVPDAQLTARYGVPGSVLFRARQDRGIPRFRILHGPDSDNYVPFPDEAVALLGKMPDVELASRFGRSLREVQQERSIRGLESYVKRRNLPDDLVEQLGLVPDAVLARRFAVSAATIKRAREARSITGFRASKQVKVCPIKTHRKRLEKDAGSSAIKGKSAVWTPQLLAQLGKIKDSDIAAQIGLSVSCVRVKRISPGIAPAQRVNWAPEALSQLGQVTDREISRLFGLSATAVYLKRRSLGIPPVQARTWTPEGLLKLGHVSDSEIAKLLGLSVSAVLSKRKSLSISPVTGAVWSAEILSQLGQVTDREIGERIGLTPSTVGSKRRSLGIPPVLAGQWTQEFISLLGKVSDKDLADLSCGALSENSVCKARLHRNIPVYQALKLPGKAEAAEVRALLGVVNDYEIARRTGVVRSEITRQRLKLGIAPAKSGRLPRKKAQAPPPAEPQLK